MPSIDKRHYAVCDVEDALKVAEPLLEQLLRTSYLFDDKSISEQTGDFFTYAGRYTAARAMVKAALHFVGLARGGLAEYFNLTLKPVTEYEEGDMDDV